MYVKNNLRYYKTINDVNQLTNQIQCQSTLRAVTKYLGYMCLFLGSINVIYFIVGYVFTAVRSTISS